MANMRLLPLALACLVSAEVALAMSPPWDVQATKIQAALKGDPQLSTKTAPNPADANQLLLTVTVAPPQCPTDATTGTAHTQCAEAASNKAKALATMLGPFGHFVPPSGTALVTRVEYSGKEVAPAAFPTQLAEAVAYMETALTNNRYFVKAAKSDLSPNTFLLFKPEAIQYYADDLAQAYGLETRVAADLFEEVFSLGSINLLRASSEPCPAEGC